MKHLTLINASRKAEEILQRNKDMCRLYKQAIRQFGEGELRTAVLDLMLDLVISKENISKEIFTNKGSLLSFCCGAWIQFLLVEVAGISKDQLRELAKRVFPQNENPKLVH